MGFFGIPNPEEVIERFTTKQASRIHIMYSNTTYVRSSFADCKKFNFSKKFFLQNRLNLLIFWKSFWQLRAKMSLETVLREVWRPRYGFCLGIGMKWEWRRAKRPESNRALGSVWDRGHSAPGRADSFSKYPGPGWHSDSEHSPGPVRQQKTICEGL